VDVRFIAYNKNPDNIPGVGRVLGDLRGGGGFEGTAKQWGCFDDNPAEVL
jgi:hypothetical protein